NVPTGPRGRRSRGTDRPVAALHLPRAAYRPELGTSPRGQIRCQTLPARRGVVALSGALLGQGDDDARGAADVTQPITVLVLHQLADELGAVGAQAGEDVLNV